MSGPASIDTPLTLACGARLSNRLVKAAMQEALADPALDPSPELERLYRRFATSGAGLLITGNVQVDADHRGRRRDVVIDGEGGGPALAAWARAARSGGAQAWVQLNHAGRQTPRFINASPDAPSAVRAVKLMGSFGPPRAMDQPTILDVIARFARAAREVQRAGWDGVQVHAAHGYLISQFLSPRTNHRTDRWGGEVANRARLLIEVVRAIRSATGAGFGVAVKMNSADFQRGGFDADDFAAVARLLDGEGIDFLEVSGGTYESPVLLRGTTSDRSAAREAYFLEFARAVRGIFTGPIMLTGGLRTTIGMQQALDEGIDLLGLARPLVMEPDLPRRLLDRSTSASLAEPVRSPARSLEGLADVAFHWAQLVRMSRGEDPDPALSVPAAMARYVAEDVAAVVIRRQPRS